MSLLSIALLYNLIGTLYSTLIIKNSSSTTDFLSENKDVEVENGMMIIEGDILIEVSEYRAAVRGRTNLWDKRIIPYMIHENMHSSAFDIIHKAINIFNEKACLHFKLRNQEPDYIVFTSKKGCYSTVGRRGGVQEISLDYNCWHEGIIIHELMHSIGFFHEHSRTDRDDFIEIVWANISRDKKADFAKYSDDRMDLLETAYDYGSIMHYSSTTFAVDKSQPTIIPVDPSAVIGQRDTFSDIDLERINKLYKCDIAHCIMPESKDNMDISESDNIVGISLYYSCHDDFQLIGSPLRYCLFDGTWSGIDPTCEEIGKIHYCNFEIDLCGWSQDETDDFDWRWASGGTPTPDTGPTYDYTIGDGSGHYVYIETSLPQGPNEKARLISPEFSPTLLSCLHFAYYMYGKTMGAINVYIKIKSTNTLLWTTSSNQGNMWHTKKLALIIPETFQIIFEGVVGDQSYSDAAIDEIILRACDADDSNNGIDVLFLPIISCDFETAGECDWIQDENVDDDFDWLRNNGPTATEGTGPENDHTFGNENGHYIYVEASSPRKQDDKAIIKTPFFYTEEPVCVSFFYHMYGQHIGSLNVYLVMEENKEVIWSLSGSQIHEWLQTKITLEKMGNIQIAFEGIVGDGNQGDISVDDFKVLRGQCVEQKI